MNIEHLESPPPGIIPGAGASAINSEKYRIRYLHADITDLGDLTSLEDILTRGLDGKDIVIVDKDKYTFQDRYWVVVTYLEKR